eukprot:symbB.v1.2.012841.t1/scaffold887.1/size155094/8
MVRSTSAPGNPFWSQRVRDEWQLASMRPSELPPIPVDSDLDGDEKVPLGDGAQEEHRGRSRSRPQKDGDEQVGTGSQAEAFRTPEQVAVKVERGWAEPSVDEQQRELEERESLEEALSREMDDWFRSRREEATEKPEDLLKMQAQRLKDQAQRLKEENMALLREQNLKLMKEVEKLKSQSHGAGEGGQSSGSEWSTVSPPVPRAMSPKRIVRTLSPSGLKMTPGGTRVPSCPPPPDSPVLDWSQMPQWPPQPPVYYDKVSMDVKYGRICDRQWSPRNARVDQRHLGWQTFGEEHGGHDGGAGEVRAGRRDGLPHHDGGAGEVRASRRDVLLQHDCGAGDVRASRRDDLLQRDCRVGDSRAWQHDEAQHGDRAGRRGDLCHPDKRARSDWSDQRDERALHDGPQREERAEDERTVKLEKQVEELKEELEKQVRKFQAPAWSSLFHKEEIKGGGHEDHTEDSLRSFPIVLPKLPEPTVRNASLEAGDWLTQVRPLIADVSTKAVQWWDNVVKATFDQYRLWLAASPLERLRIPAPSEQELSKGYQRLAQRVSVMMMQSLPEGLKQEMIAMRQMDSVNILYKIFKTYQPGGLAERRQMLAELTVTGAATTASEAVASLRLWKRQAQRAQGLRVVMPDAVLQVKALSTIMEQLLAVDTQAAFRVNAYRMQHGIDVAPSEVDINLFFELLLAEAEQMVTSTSRTSEVTGSKEVKPGVKVLQTVKNGICQFWGSAERCRFGRRCKFNHDWQQLSDKSGRCWLCSSQKHLKHDCPTMKGENGEEDPPKSSVGGSDTFSTGKSGGGKGSGYKGYGDREKGFGKKGGKKGKFGSNGATGNGKGGAVDQQGDAAGAVADTKKDSKEQEAEGRSKNDQEKGSGEKPETKILEEVTHLLKSMRIQTAEPQMRVCQVKQLSASEPRSALLDSGATHCLRKASSLQEWDSAAPVRVMLASGEAELRQCQETSTLLTQEEVQMVLPVAKILEVGYTLLWTKEGCRVEHPSLGKVPVRLAQGCPTVGDDWGKMMMQDIEDLEKRRAKIRSILVDGVLAEDEYEKKVAELRTMFPVAPLRVLERIPGEESWDANQLPFNRKARRKIMKADRVMVNMFAGSDVKRWSVVEDQSTAVISIDVMHGGNALCPHLTGWLNSVIDTGKVVMWTSGPPCRTVSILRKRGAWDNGPQQLRSRMGEKRYGLDGLTAAQRELVDHDSAIWLKNLWWMRRVKKKNPRAELLLEQPQDPEEWLKEGNSGSEYDRCPSFLIWPETQEMIKDLKLTTTRFDQGAVGAGTPKPTAVVSDVQEIQCFEGLKAKRKDEEWPERVEEGIEKSRRMAQWAPGMVRAIVAAMRRLDKKQEAVVKALTAKEKAEVADWEAHFASGHIPFRRDCMCCVWSRWGGAVLGGDRVIQTATRWLLMSQGLFSLEKTKNCTSQGDGLQKKEREQAVLDVQDEGSVFGAATKEEGQKEQDEGSVLGTAASQKGQKEQDEGSVLGTAASQKGQEEQVWDCEEEEQQEELSQAEVTEMEKANEEWKKFLVEVKEQEMQTLTWGVPLKSRNAKDVVEALSRIHTRFRAMQVPIYRLHSDRAREFVSAEVKKWARSQSLLQTYTAGDEPQSNGRCEREVGIIKARTRVLLRASRSAIHLWPLAARQAMEERCREQLAKMGIRTPPILPFGEWLLPGESRGSIAVSRGNGLWKESSVMDLQPTWGWGAGVTTFEDGKFIRSTIIVVPKQKAETLEEVRQQRQQGLGDGVTLDAQGSVEDATLDVKGDHREEQEQMWDPDELEILMEKVAQLEEDFPRGQDRESTSRATTSKPRLKRNPLLDHERQAAVSLCQLQGKGEWQEEEENRVALQLWQHRELTKILQEEVSNWLEGNEGSAATVKAVRQEVKNLESQLARAHVEECEIHVKSLQAKMEQEVLQTRVVEMSEVRQDLEGWREAFVKEYKSLTSGPVVPMSAEEYAELEATGVEIERLPMKSVTTLKPPNRRKARLVVCGNWSDKEPEMDVSALQCKNHGAEPPSILRSLGLVGPGEKWKVQCALYGMVESPSDWAAHRDGCMDNMVWKDDQGSYRLRRTPERHLWNIEDDKGRLRGAVVVYVDDLFVVAEETKIGGVFEAIKRTWQCSEEERVTEDAWMRFCGYELKKTKDGVMIAQPGYTEDLLRRRQVEGTEECPCPKVDDQEDEENDDGRILREAQTITGELMWLSGRSRPDISYVVGLMSRLLHRRPGYVCSIGRHVLKYLNGTKSFGLEYLPFEKAKCRNSQHLPCDRLWEQVIAHADASFAPPHEKHRSVQSVVLEHAGNILMWETTRQPFIAQSTAEAEVLGYNEAYQATESMSSLLQIFMKKPIEKVLLGDNKAALTLCCSETGPWRTRHIRLRAAKLREALAVGSDWKALHLAGGELVADGGTKALLGQAFMKFRTLLGMADGSRVVGVLKRCTVGSMMTSLGRVELDRVLLAMGGLLISSGVLTVGLLLALVACLKMWDGTRARSLRPESRPQQDSNKIGKGEGAQCKGFGRSGTTTNRKMGSGKPSGSPETPLGSDPWDRKCSVAVRALRFDGKKEDPKKPGAQRRGYNAMPLHDRLQKIADQGKVVDEKVDQLAEELEKTLKTLDEEVPRGRSASSSGLNSTTSGTMGTATSPWNSEEFQKPPRLVSDQWRLDFYESGWIIRTHGKARKAPFHPVHRSFPGESGQLSEERVTVLFDPAGNREVKCDNWSGRPWRFEDRSKTWKGYTFFKKKLVADATTTSGATASGAAVGSADEVKPQVETVSSDGSFEQIDD